MTESTVLRSTMLALNDMDAAYRRLLALGWRDADYGPKDGTTVEVIEAGSAGIHEAYYQGEWPTGNWWIIAEGDLWPSSPILFRLKEKQQ